MKLSHAIAKYLVDKGVDVVFGYQGGSITHMIDSFDKYGIKYIQSYNEQGAGLAADAYARVSQVGFSVAIGTNGPGATNLITAIANAYCDSVPIVFFTGQVHTYAMKKNDKIRQESFQEIDILSMVRYITKYAVTIMDKNDALFEINKALKIALDGRKGPVLIDIPVDVQGQDVEYKYSEFDIAKRKEDIDIDNVLIALSRAKKPLIIAGGGIRAADAVDLFRFFIEKTGIPVVTSLMGLDVLPHDSEFFIGYMGTYGNRYANLAVQNADVILVIGSRLDVRQTGKQKDLFAPNAIVIHVDVDECELGHYIDERIKIRSDIKVFLNCICKKKEIEQLDSYSDWKLQIIQWKTHFPNEKEFDIESELNPNIYLKEVGERIPNHSVVTFDVGQNQMWSAQSLRLIGDDFRIVSSGGLGTMGYSLPASIGAFFADKTKKVFALMGDGGFQMNIQELQMISYYKAPIKIIVLKNNALGLIRDIHEKYYERRYVGSVDGFSVPPLDKIAVAYNMRYFKISNYDDCNQLETIFRDERAWLIEIELIGNTYTRPELLGEDGLDHQSPYVSRKL